MIGASLASALLLLGGFALWASRASEAGTVGHSATLVTLVAAVALAFAATGIWRLLRIQHDLVQSHDMFRDMAESGSDWFWETDENHRFCRFDMRPDKSAAQASSPYLGFTRADLPVREEDRGAVAASMETMRRREPFRDLVYGLRQPDGQISFLKVTGKPFFDVDGRFRGYRGTAQDATEEIRDKNDREEGRRLLHRALVMAGQGHWRQPQDAADKIWLSRELIELLRLDNPAGDGLFPRQEILSRYRGTPLEELRTDIREQWRTGDRAIVRVGFERGDGVEVIIEIQSFPVETGQGRKRADYGIVRDVTEEVVSQQLIARTSQQIEERTKLLSRSMNIARMGFWRAINADADPLWLSQELCDLWGLAVEEGYHPLSLIQGGALDDGGYVQSVALQETWATGIPRIATSRFSKADGEVIDILVQMEAEFDARGRVAGVTGVVRDITAEHQALAAIEQGRTTLANLAAALERAEDIAELGHWRMDLNTGQVEGSRSARDVLGIEPDSAFPMPIELIDRVHEADRDHFAMTINESLSQSNASATVRFEHPMKGWRHTRFVIETEFGDDGHPSSVFGIVQDVTGQKIFETQLAARTEALNEAHEMGRMGDWSYRLGDVHVRWSPQVYNLLRLPMGQFEPVREKILDLYVGEGRDVLLAAQATVFRTGGVKAVDVQLRLGDGSVGDFTVTSKADRDESGAIIGLVGTIQDISDRKRSERELEKLAFYDPLTSLSNRALFQRQITRIAESCVAGGQTGALLLLDLDRFKEVNDSLGHAAGDELLLKVSQCLRRILPADAMLARLGGDEFAIILPGADRDLAAACAETVVGELAKPFALRLGEVNIGSSVGIALIPQDGQNADELMRHGDLALYRAKDDGRGRARFFESEFSELAQEKSRLARDLRVAVDTSGQLELHFQPQVRLSDFSVTGFEALLRWKHPTRGYVPPSEFVPIAESSTLIHDLGVWVLRQGCAQMKAWLDAGHPKRTMAINVSAAQLWHTEFEDEVARALALTGLPPECLVLELTESVFVADGLSRVRIALDRLKTLGVRLALDDFGTGYSSLGYLNQLPFEKLKIDRCFVRGIEHDAHKRKLLKGVVALGQGLGMVTVAEGAEDEGEVAALQSIGCNQVQGYVFSRPVPAGEAIAAAERIEARRQSSRTDRAA